MPPSRQESTQRQARLRTPLATRLTQEGAILRDRRVAAIVAASLAARLPFSIMGLATVFYVQGQTGSFAAAGLAVGAFSLTSGALAPLRGRLVDRRGMRRGLLPLGCAHAAATLLVLLAGAVGGSAALLVLATAACGATAPPVNASMRSLWPSLVEPRQLDSAYGLEVVLQEISFLLGPLIAGVLISLFSTATPIAVSALLTVLGVAAIAAQRVAREWKPAVSSAQNPLRSAGVRTIVAALAVGAVSLGVLEVAVPAFGEEHGSAASAGVLFSVMAAGSIAGGVWYGTRKWRVAAIWRFIAASTVAIAGYALTIPASSLALFGLGLLLFGVTLAPALAAVYSLLDDVAPDGTAVESVTWITTATALGAALGAAVAGVVVQRASIQSALIIGTASAALAAAIPAYWRRTLRPGSGSLEQPQLPAERSVH